MKRIATLPTGFVVVLFLTMLFTLKAWFSMPVDMKMVSPLLAVLMVAVGSKYFRTDNSTITTILLCLVSYFVSTRGNMNAYIGSFLSILPFFVFCFYRRDIRIRFFYVFNKLLAILIAISTAFWILHLLGVPLLHSSLVYGENYAYNNYYFFLDFIFSISYLDFFPRFYCIFIEPSIIGMLSAFMLFLDGFKLKKWYNIVYLVALLLTFSLAGFVLFAVALIPHVLYGSGSRSSSRFWYLFIIAVVLGFGYYAMYVADQSSVVYQMFGHRLEWNEDTGTIAGYDRSGENLDDFVKTKFWESGNVLFGFGPDFPLNGVDWKVFLVKYGIVSLVLYILFLFTCYLQRKSRMGLWWFILFIMACYRGYSIMFWPGFLILYVMGLDYLYYSKDKRLDAWNSPLG